MSQLGTVLGAIEVTTGAWGYRLSRRRAADFIALPGLLAQAFPQAPVITAVGVPREPWPRSPSQPAPNAADARRSLVA
jgi:hypothetical protein